MRKLVLGIALVVVLDLAFIFSAMNEKVAKEVALAEQPKRAPAVEIKAPPPAEIPEDNPAESEPEVALVDQRSVDAPERTVKRIRDEEPQAEAAPTPAPRYAPYQPAEKFQDTIIWIAKAEYVPIERPEPIASPPPPQEKQAAVTAPARKKRSLWSKSYRVIRKPYDWVKTAVSKL